MDDSHQDSSFGWAPPRKGLINHYRVALTVDSGSNNPIVNSMQYGGLPYFALEFRRCPFSDDDSIHYRCPSVIRGQNPSRPNRVPDGLELEAVADGVKALGFFRKPVGPLSR